MGDERYVILTGRKPVATAPTESVLSASSPSKSSGRFNISYFDSLGSHVVRSPSFYWIH